MIEKKISPDIKVQYRQIASAGTPSTRHIERLIGSFDDANSEDFNIYAENTMGAWFKEQQGALDAPKKDIALPGVQLLGATVLGRVVEYEVSDATKIMFVDDTVHEGVFRFSTLFMASVDNLPGLVFADEPEMTDTKNKGVFIPREGVPYLHLTE
jgi:hypothetical protein